MFEKIDMFKIICDRCGKEGYFKENEGESSIKDTIKNLEKNGWFIKPKYNEPSESAIIFNVKGTHISVCPDCKHDFIYVQKLPVSCDDCSFYNEGITCFAKEFLNFENTGTAYPSCWLGKHRDMDCPLKSITELLEGENRICGM